MNPNEDSKDAKKACRALDRATAGLSKPAQEIQPGRDVHFTFDIGDKVLVKEIQRPGRVEGLLIDYLGVQYRVAYWDNGKRETQWLQGDELERR